jgi:hypothetical protein
MKSNFQKSNLHIPNRVIIAGIGRSIAYFTYDRESLDFSCQYRSFLILSLSMLVISRLPKLLSDVFYNFLIWTSIEPCLGVVGCCLPTLGPLTCAIDIKYSEIYSKIKSTFSKQSLIDRGTAKSSHGVSGQRNDWIQLTGKKSNQSELEDIGRV